MSKLEAQVFPTTDIPGITLEIVEAVKDVGRWVQEYNEKVIKKEDNALEEEITLHMQKMQDVHRQMNEALQEGALNNILVLMEKALDFQDEIMLIADECNITAVEDLFNGSGDIEALFDNLDIAKLEQIRSFSDYDSKQQSFNDLASGQLALAKMGQKAQLLQAKDMLRRAEDLKSKAEQIDSDLNTTVLRTHTVDAITGEVLERIDIEDKVESVIANMGLDADECTFISNNYESFRSQLVGLMAERERERAEELSLGASPEDLTGYVVEIEALKVELSFLTAEYLKCLQGSDFDDKATATVELTRELVERMVMILGLDVGLSFRGITEINSEPLLRMNDAERIEALALRNRYLEQAAQYTSDAVELIAKASEESDATSREKALMKQEQLSKDVLSIPNLGF